VLNDQRLRFTNAGVLPVTTNGEVPLKQITPRPYGSSRVASIDAARGAAMLFVCLAHFTNAYFFLNGRGEIGVNLVVIGMIASPTFVTVSGLVAGFLSVTRRSSFVNLRRKLIDRGVFLLIAGHLVLALSGLVTGRGLPRSYRIEYITDAIGFAILIGPWLIAKLPPRSRLVLAAAVFMLDWAAILFWEPSAGFATIVKQYLVGAVVGGQWEVTAGGFAFIPWLAVYLVGTAIGERVGSYYGAHRQVAAHLFLARVGLLCIGGTLLVKVGLLSLKRWAPLFAQAHLSAFHVLSFYQKFPPGPVYICFFGGAGMLLVGGILEAARRRIQPLLINQLRQIGLASFFVYIVQFYIYSVLLAGLRLPYSAFWPLILLLSIVLLALVANVWNSFEGNRFLTVGIGPLLERIANRRRTVFEPPVALGLPQPD
jgi:uncharacterized membrane protein